MVPLVVAMTVVESLKSPFSEYSKRTIVSFPAPESPFGVTSPDNLTLDEVRTVNVSFETVGAAGVTNLNGGLVVVPTEFVALIT